MRRPPIWQLLLGTALLCAVVAYFVLSSETTPLPRLRSQRQEPEFYPWRTITSFGQVSQEESETLTAAELCRHFPKDKLQDIQPVLKTGHGVLDRVRVSLQSTSACLDNLLIFSDLDEEVDGRPVLDVIAEYPQMLLQSTNETLPYRELNELAANGTLTDETMSKVQGWRTDRFKFIPAISRAWQLAPEKKWYVFYEGDTYVAWDTVLRLLNGFDADGLHYFGSPTPRSLDGVWFANGGPGYIIYRGAMRRLVKDDWDTKTGEWKGCKLFEQYWKDIVGDCCGDSVLGRAIYDHGTKLKGLWPMFNPHPLHGLPFSDQHWCQPVLSMHKLDDDDAVKLWRWEWAHRQVHRPLLYRDLAISYWRLGTLDRRQDWDNGEWDAYRPSPDDPHQPDASPDACSTACEKAVGGGCFQWTYHLRRCWFVRSFRVGRSKGPQVEKEYAGKDWNSEDRRYIAGWNNARIQQWINERPCAQVQWIRPSTQRVF